MGMPSVLVTPLKVGTFYLDNWWHEIEGKLHCSLTIVNFPLPYRSINEYNNQKNTSLPYRLPEQSLVGSPNEKTERQSICHERTKHPENIHPIHLKTHTSQ